MERMYARTTAEQSESRSVSCVSTRLVSASIGSYDVPADSLPTTNVSGRGRFAAGVARTAFAVARKLLRDDLGAIA